MQLLRQDMDRRFDELTRHMDVRFQLQDEKPFRVEQVLDARLKHREERESKSQVCNVMRACQALLVALCCSRLQGQPTIVEYPIPTAASGPGAITYGPDGNLWFTESDANKIGRITVLAGAITEFAIPTPNSKPWAITAGPDGNLWFTEIEGNRIGKITPAGVITEYALPGVPVPGLTKRTNGITAGPDGNLWFTEPDYGRIGRITASGVLTEFRIPSGVVDLSYPTNITDGFDGTLWFTGSAGVGQITVAGGITAYPLIVGVRASPLGLRAIRVDSTGKLWVSDGGYLWRVDSGGVSAGYPAAADQVAFGFIPGFGGLWFTSGDSNKVGLLTLDGVLTQYPVPSPNSRPAGITEATDGNMWFTEQAGNRIGKLVMSNVPAEPTLNITPSIGLRFTSFAPPNQSSAPQTVSVTTSPSAEYSVSTSVLISSGPPWLSISPSGNLRGSQSFTVSLNLKQFNFGTFGNYSGDIIFAFGNVTQILPVTLRIVRPIGPQRISKVVNAASFANGPTAPGEVISVFGTSLGPSNPLGLALDPAGNVPKLLGGVSVEINGYAAPLTYVSSTQINCVVPYEYGVGGVPVAEVQVLYQNQASPVFSVSVTETAPGVFTLDGSGAGQAAALNDSGTINGPAAPTSPGGVITLYVTGEGWTMPPSPTGGVTTPNAFPGPVTPQPLKMPFVTVGGIVADVLFYGEAPGLLAGVMQINARVPDGLSTGNQSVLVSLGGAQSQRGVTLSVW